MEWSINSISLHVQQVASSPRRRSSISCSRAWKNVSQGCLGYPWVYWSIEGSSVGNIFIGVEDVRINYPSIYNTNMEIHVWQIHTNTSLGTQTTPCFHFKRLLFGEINTYIYITYKELNGVLPPQLSGMVDDTRNRSYTVTSVSRQDSFSAVNSGWHSHWSI